MIVLLSFGFRLIALFLTLTRRKKVLTFSVTAGALFCLVMAQEGRVAKEIMEFVKAHQSDKFMGAESDNARQWLDWINAGLALYN